MCSGGGLGWGGAGNRSTNLWSSNMAVAAFALSTSGATNPFDAEAHDVGYLLKEKKTEMGSFPTKENVENLL